MPIRYLVGVPLYDYVNSRETLRYLDGLVALARGKRFTFEVERFGDKGKTGNLVTKTKPRLPEIGERVKVVEAQSIFLGSANFLQNIPVMATVVNLHIAEMRLPLDERTQRTLYIKMQGAYNQPVLRQLLAIRGFLEVRCLSMKVQELRQNAA